MKARTYQAPVWLRNAHVQSVLSSLPLRRSAAQRVLARTGAQTREQLVDAGDGVRLQGFHDSVPGRDARALVLLLHGWEGSSQSAYMLLTAARLVSKGFDVFRLNFRDHGDTHHLNEGLFHSCRLAEVLAAAQDVAARYAPLPFLAAGYSLGGNFALRLALAAPASGLPLRHAAAVCPAVDPSAVMRTLESGSALYNWYFMKKWRSSLRKKRALFPQQHDFDDAVLAQDMRSLTRWLVLKHTDMGDVEDYFEGYSVSGGRLANLEVPVSVLASADDPVIPVETFRSLQLPAHSHLDIAEHGGHCGFIEGPSLRGFAERWVAQRLLDSLDAA
jgi:predicted alpha/beta-fold hydrolase